MKKTIPVIGLACSACSARVEQHLSGLKGIESCSVSLAGRTALVEFDPEVISLEEMKREVNDIGYDLVIEEDRNVAEIEQRERKALLRKTLLAWVLTVLVMCFSMRWIDTGSLLWNNVVALVLALLCMVICGRTFYRNAWKQVRHGAAGMDTLVALSTGIAFLFSAFNTFFGEAVWGSRGIEWHTYFDASVMILTFVLFRADNIGSGLQYIASMFTGFRFDAASGFAKTVSLLSPYYLLMLVIGIIIAAPVSRKLKGVILGRKCAKLYAPLAAVGTLLLFGLCLLAQSTATYNPFIYFRF